MKRNDGSPEGEDSRGSPDFCIVHGELKKILLEENVKNALKLYLD